MHYPPLFPYIQHNKGIRVNEYLANLLLRELLENKGFIQNKRTIGFDTIQFRKDFNDPEIFNTINSHIESLYKKGIFGTPPIVVGNLMYLNVHTMDELTKIIDNTLKRNR